MLEPSPLNLSRTLNSTLFLGNTARDSVSFSFAARNACDAPLKNVELLYMLRTESERVLWPSKFCSKFSNPLMATQQTVERGALFSLNLGDFEPNQYKDRNYIEKPFHGSISELTPIALSHEREGHCVWYFYQDVPQDLVPLQSVWNNNTRPLIKTLPSRLKSAFVQFFNPEV